MWSLHTTARNMEDENLSNRFANLPIFMEGPIKSKSSLAIRYQSCYSARIVCLDTFPEEELLVCGDQRGNIVAFNLLSIIHEQVMQPSPLATFKGAHGISAVASVRIIGKRNKEQIKICSTGRDGYICTFALEKSGATLFCLRVEKVSAITLIESYALCSGIIRGASARTIVAGFIAEDFLIYDQQNDCEIARVSCGGWRRPHAYLIGDSPEVQHCFVYMKDGMIHVFRKWSMTSNKSSTLLLLSKADRSLPFSSLLLQSQFHGKEVHSVNFVASAQVFKDHSHSTSWITTGAEDGVVRILRFKEDALEHFDVSQVLGEHVGGSAVRAVTSVTEYSLCNTHCLSVQTPAPQAESSCILISVGAKEVLTCWLLEWEEALDRTGQPAQTLSSRWLSTKRYMRNLKSKRKEGVHDDGPERQNALTNEDAEDDDLRYLAVTSFSVFCPQTRLTTYFATTASSNASVILHAFQISGGNWVEVGLLDYHKAPVLTLQHLVIPDYKGKASQKFMVFSGATDGSIAIWDVTEIVLEFCHKQLGQGNERMFRPPSGRGSQGGRRWKLSKHHGGDQKLLSINGRKSDKDATSKVSHDNLDCNLNANHAKDGTHFSHSVKPELLLPFAHQSGVNSLSVSLVKGEDQTPHDNPMWIVVSGGDDQALHVGIFRVAETKMSSSSERACTVCLSEVSVLSAHSSAVKGVWTDGIFVFTTGLDQRLRLWKLTASKQSCCLTECCQIVINVPEPAALHVEQLVGNSYRIAVVGRGLQMFKVKGD